MMLRLLALLLVLAIPASATTRLNVAIGADVNVVEVHKTLLGPGFREKTPDVELNVVGTGTGEPASRAIYTKIKAQADTGRKPWDLDVALVSMAVASQMVKEGLLHRYVPQMRNAALVKGAEVKEAFGVSVDGYVVPMFHNQIALAYNPAKVATPPRSFDDLAAWVKANPGKFGYNGIKGGVSGVGFTMGWVYWKTGQYKQLTQGPFDRGKEGAIREAITALRDFNRSAILTTGNAGTLDALNRGEIWMGVVWIDQLVAWKNEGRMDPSITPTLPAPGLPIYPLYLVIPREAASKEMATRYIDYIATPEVQARAIVERFGWYPGVDAEKVLPLIAPKSRELLFKGVSAEDLARYSRQMPIKEYHDLITLAYEEIVRSKRMERALWLALCAPAPAILAVVFVWPLAASVGASFTRDGALTLANYETVWRLYARDVAYTVGVAAAGAALTFAAAIPLCGWLRARAFGPVEFLLKVPLFVPFVVVGHALRVALAPHAPAFTSSWAGLAVALAWKHLGLAVLLMLGAFRGVDEGYLEAARGFGAGTTRLTRDVLVPMAAPALAVSAILIFSSMLASFSIPLMMSRGGGPQMLMIDVYYRFGQHGDFATASALGVVAYLLAMGAALVYVRRLTSDGSRR